VTHEPHSAAERLLEDSWEARRRRRASQRELLAQAAAGALFVLVATALAVLTHPAVHLGPALALIALYASVVRIEFPVGAGHAVPTQLVLVPMLVVLAPALVPLAVALGLLTAATIDWRLGRVPARRLVSAVPDAWHSVGPALVLIAAGSPRVGFEQLPLLGAAFLACCAADFASSLLRMSLMGIVPDRKALLGVMLTVWAVDACLAPVGLLTAEATAHGARAVIFILPLAGLLGMLARDRNRRIEQAHERLRLVAHERERLQTAVRRLGDAFAAKLELDSLLEILLHGSIEALDAGAGRLHLDGLPEPFRLRAGEAHGAALTVPIGIPADVSGELTVVRDGRPFDDDERALLRELVTKAEQAAGEILAHQALRAQAMTDPLTGIGNRRRLARDLRDALDEGAPALLLLFDLDGFKTYNDTLGHVAGDHLLTRLGAKLTTAVGSHGETYRLGGDEFCALLALEHAGDVEDLLSRAVGALTETGEGFSVGASLGAVLLPHEAATPEQALRLADQRMYAAKHARRNGPREQARDLLLRAMQAKQPHLDEHSSGVAERAERVGRWLGLGGEALDEIRHAAELHDVGKVGIPDAILGKPAPLDGDEWAFMQEHTVLGEHILDAAPALRPVAALVRASHERWDGTGYPDRLAGAEIPLGARIIAVCDAYEAMTADRPYRQALGEDRAREELQAHAGTQFDPDVVEAFLRTLEGNFAGEEDAAGAVGAAAAHIRALLGDDEWVATLAYAGDSIPR
jgi:diguanylate cyclase (GGDEF)-like protein